MPDLNFCVVDIDAGTALSERVSYAAAQQRQLREHFAPLWDGLCSESSVRACTPSTPPLTGEVQIRLLKNAPTDQQGALALHDRQPDGTPICYVFVGLLASYGEGWTSAASHEVLETAGDPRLHLCVELDDGTIWDREIADRVQSQSYQIDGVSLSNFNTPQCFEPPSTLTGVKFDYLGFSKSPNQTCPGGYSQKLDPAKGWQQIEVGLQSPYRKDLFKLGLSRGAKRVARQSVKKKPWWRIW